MSHTSLQEQRAPEAIATELDVELHEVSKVFDGEAVVRSVDLRVRRGEFFSILGPSGCGKTTLLRLVAGFEMPSAGEVLIRGESMNRVPPYRRPVNTVFQSYALFNHLSVWENVAFGLRLKRQPISEVEERVKQALWQVKMAEFANRFPGQLSGGQQQRVALARALVNRPAVVLLDEPLGALDFKLRKQMQVELSNLHRDLGLTFVMVTHDQEEALSLSDRIAVMRGGAIEQIGSPSEIYESPRTAFVADFIGETNLFEGRIESVDGSTLAVITKTGLQMVVQLQPGRKIPEPTRTLTVSVRPEKIRLSFSPPANGTNCFEGRLNNIMYLGTHAHYVVELIEGDRITAMLPNTAKLPESPTPIYVCWEASDCLALEE
jgi:spermidine/putrescine transport system ATP-binding protein